MPESPIRKMAPFADKAKEKGIKVYHLNIGQPDIETPEVALNKIKTNDLKVIGYGPSAGIDSYRKKLADYYCNYGIQINHNDIIVTTGGSEAIMFAFMSTMNQGDEVIVPEPFYANYYGFATAAGVRIKPITSYIDNGFALPPIHEFENLITEYTKAILICNPNNPTGYVYSKDELEALKALVKKYDLYLFADEVYKEFCYDGLKFHSVLQMEELKENVVVMDSVSKRYSACGMRIGALISRNKAFMDTAIKFAQARLSAPTYGQMASEAAIDVPESYFSGVLEEYYNRRNLLVESLNKIEGVECPTPKGAFYAVAKLPVDDSNKFCQWLLESFNYKGETVMLAPLSGFYATKGLGKDEIRIGYVLNMTDLTNAIKCIEEGLKVYPGKTN